MTAPWQLICLALALVFAAIAAFAWTQPFDAWRVRLLSCAVFFYLLSLLVK